MAITTVLTIGASDSCGADGVQADLRTFAALKCHGATAITVVTAQNTQAITAAEFMSVSLVEAQIRAVFDDLEVTAVKLGALGSAEMVETVADALDELCEVPIAADTVMVSHAGEQMVDDAAITAFKARIVPKLMALVCNLDEAALLTGTARGGTLGDLMEQGEALVALGAKNVLVSGGQGQAEQCTDILCTEGRPPVRFGTPRLERNNMRGLSGTLAAAMAAHFAHGINVNESIQLAKVFTTGAIETADTFSIGSGPGPIHQLNRPWG